MVRIITDYLEETVRRVPDKIAFADEHREMTFRELRTEAMRIAEPLIRAGLFKKPVVVYLDKRAEAVSAFLGAAYSGNFYSPVDTQMPAERIARITEKLQPAAVITDEKHREEARGLMPEALLLTLEETARMREDEALVLANTERILDTDVLYVLFTSGSTGVPKGVIISHRGLVDLSEWIAADLRTDENTVFASQTPFYFSFSIFDIYQTVRNGATTWIVPHALFSQPVKLMEYLEEKQVNTVNWVPSVLTFLSSLHALNRPHLSRLKNVIFGGENFQARHLNRWMDEYPETRFVNVYGPTEVTDTCTWYEVNRRLAEDELLPIGICCRNKDCFLLDGDRLVTATGELGEICMRGSGIAYGYYRDPERTAEVFVQNPLQDAYREIIYRTGDLGRFNERGEMVYVGRKDFQIKHAGHRIELGEIETAVSSLEGIAECCCLYDLKRLRIVLYYTGTMPPRDVNLRLKEKLPDYMIPGKRVQLEEMPHNLNGKIDRQRLKAMLEADEG